MHSDQSRAKAADAAKVRDMIRRNFKQRQAQADTHSDCMPVDPAWRELKERANTTLGNGAREDSDGSQSSLASDQSTVSETAAPIKHCEPTPVHEVEDRTVWEEHMLLEGTARRKYMPQERPAKQKRGLKKGFG
jgi:hypothetical protein